jgi:hypothetical protein
MYYIQPGNTFGFTRNSDDAVRALKLRQDGLEDVLKKYGYGGEYPRKEVIITETNIPGKQFANNIGSPEAQRNYLLKLAVLGQKNHVSAIHPYCVWDNAEQNGNGWDYDYMGFYKPLPDAPGGTLRVNESGLAWRTASRTLKERKYDDAETAKLSLPKGVEGGAFHSSKTNDYVYVLWAKTSRDRNETASASYTFPTAIRANRLNVTAWNGTVSDINGRVITLTGSPVFIKCQ